MALEFIEGFDWYSHETQGRMAKWDSNNGNNNTDVGRWPGSFAVGLDFGSPLPLLQGQLTAVKTRIIGFAFKPSNFAEFIVDFWDIPAGVLTRQTSFRMNSSSLQAEIVRWNGGTAVSLGNSGAKVFLVNVWHYVEIKMTIGDSDGAAVLRVNGADWINLSGVDTQQTVNPTQMGISLAAPNPSTMWVDDLYILNTSGAKNNDFLGECRIYTVLATADTIATATNRQWTPDSGTTNYSRVNEFAGNWPGPNDETNPGNPATPSASWVYTNTPGAIDTYQFPDITPTGPIAGLQTTVIARKDDVGVRKVKTMYRSGAGTNYEGTVEFTPFSSYVHGCRQVYEDDPATGTTWTPAGINAGEFGMKCTV